VVRAGQFRRFVVRHFNYLRAFNRLLGTPVKHRPGTHDLLAVSAIDEWLIPIPYIDITDVFGIRDRIAIDGRPTGVVRIGRIAAGTFVGCREGYAVQDEGLNRDVLIAERGVAAFIGHHPTAG